MNKIIKSTITILALLAVGTAYGEGADSSVELYISGGAARSNNDEYINVFFHKVPYSYGGYLNPYISIEGFINGEYFSCSRDGSTQPTPVITVDLAPTASEASLQVNTSELGCWGVVPLQITMNCVANGQYDSSFVSNGTIKTEGVMYKYHGNKKSKYANCTFTADQVSFNTNESQNGQLEYTQYINITH